MSVTRFTALLAKGRSGSSSAPRLLAIQSPHRALSTPTTSRNSFGSKHTRSQGITAGASFNASTIAPSSSLHNHYIPHTTRHPTTSLSSSYSSSRKMSSSAAAATTSSSSSSSFLQESNVPCVLDNKPWSGLSSTYDLKDPHSPEGKVLYKVACVNEKEAQQAVESAAKAYKSWKNVSAFDRRTIFLKALALLEQRKDEFVKIAVEETTGNQFWGVVDWQLTWNIISETAAVATQLQGAIVPAEHGQRAYVERVPFGVVLGIAPWNAPLTLGVRAFANAIMAGNTVVFKTSEYSPKIHTFAAQLFADAGLPEGVLNLIHVAPQDAPGVIESVIAHPAVRKINFTGSTVVGSKIAQVAAKHVKPTVMELGGKAPVVVMKDANLQAAANAVVFGGLSHSGQICMASDGLIVHEDIADEFIKVLSGLINERQASAKPEGFRDWRGLFSKVSADRVTGLVKDAIDKGAKVVVGKQHTDYNIVQPVILEGTTPEMRIHSEEIFGPAFTFQRFKTAEEAIEIANAREYGLAASIWGSNETECFKIAQEIESGQVHINGATVHDTQVVPHGGMKKSGYGRFNGVEGLKEFSQTKTITINPVHGQYPI